MDAAKDPMPFNTLIRRLLDSQAATRELLGHIVTVEALLLAEKKRSRMEQKQRSDEDNVESQ